MVNPKTLIFLKNIFINSITINFHDFVYIDYIFYVLDISLFINAFSKEDGNLVLLNGIFSLILRNS